MARAPWRIACACACGCAMAACRPSQATRWDATDASADASVEAASRVAIAIDAAPADDAMPPTSSDELTARARHLMEAIANDNPDLATDILFPRDGWAATRDADDPGKDWDKRVRAPFDRAIHKLSKRNKDVARAQFVSIALGRAMAQAAPKRRGWKTPLWSVRDSRLTFVVDGRTRTLSIRELTAWRGAWYVTRLR